MQAVALDIRFALRTFRRRRLYAALAIGTLALGISAATTIYGVVDRVLLRPLPYADSDRLVAVFRTFPKWREQEGLHARWDRIWFSYPGFIDWQSRQTSFDAVGVWAGGQRTLTGVEAAEQVDVVRASSSLLHVLRLTPALGRAFLPGEDRVAAAAVAMISHEMWVARFGASPSALGRTLTLDGTSYEIVGVLPRGLDLWARGRASPIWIPAGSEPSDARAGSTNFFAVGRLRSGVTVEQATDETRRLVAESAPPDPVGARLDLWQHEMTRTARRPLLLLLGASAVLLLLACVNVATLMLGEASGRVDEFATRAALGAGRMRVARQVLTESLVIAAAAVVAGGLIARLGTTALVLSAPDNVPRLAEAQLDLRVLAACCLVAAVTAVLVGLVPAGSLMSVTPSRLLGSGSGRSTRRHDHRTMRALVSLQVALSCLLLVGAALLARSLQRLGSVDPGFAGDRLTVIGLGTPIGSDVRDENAITTLYADAAEQIAAIPGVERVAVGSAIPFTGGGSSSTFTIEGQLPAPGAQGIEMRRSHVLPGFIETFGLRLLAGRAIEGQDRAGSPLVAVVNEKAARTFWPGEAAVGKRIGFGDDRLTIVGVVSDVKHASLGDSVRVTVYLPVAQQPTRYLMLLVRTRLDLAALTPLVRRAVATVDAAVPVTRVDAMPELVDRSFAAERFRTMLIGVFAIVAGMLATIGTYGVTARAVVRQRREVGVRMALGSTATRVVALFLRRAGSAVTLGIVLGLAGALGLSKFLAPYLYATPPTEPVVYAVSAALLATTALLAAWLPAYRASRANPATVLRNG